MKKLRDLLRGKKAYLVGALMLISALLQSLQGDTWDWRGLWEQRQTILEAFGIGALRAGMVNR